MLGSLLSEQACSNYEQAMQATALTSSSPLSTFPAVPRWPSPRCRAIARPVAPLTLGPSGSAQLAGRVPEIRLLWRLKLCDAKQCCNAVRVGPPLPPFYEQSVLLLLAVNPCPQLPASQPPLGVCATLANCLFTGPLQGLQSRGRACSSWEEAIALQVH